ncbi:4Fe-4S dicluster domain-containing protein [bacterium]|nr:4Fe-4S dicluster domain-containing protein [bacterium]
MEKKTIQDKLNSVKYNCDSHGHLILNQEICQKCNHKVCTFICPASVYSESDAGEIIVQYENCLECGACRIACPLSNIEWHYPSSGCGVIYKNS